MDAHTRQLRNHRSEAMTLRAPAPRDEEPQAIESRSLGIPRSDDVTHRHEGSFAAGQELILHHPERPGEKGDFAAGEELQRYTHQSTFAEGQDHADPHPELLENRGGFAAGQRKLTGMRLGTQRIPSFL